MREGTRRVCWGRRAHNPTLSIRLLKPRLLGYMRNYAAVGGTELNQRTILDLVGKELGIAEPSDWYGVTWEEVGHVPLAKDICLRFNSLGQALSVVYPDVEWDKARFAEAEPSEHYTTRHRKLIDRIGAKLGVKEISDWYAVTRTQVQRNGGYALFHNCHSLEAALRAAYPTYPWESARFAHTRKKPLGHWNDPTNLLTVLERAERTLGIRQPDDWYSVNLSDLFELGFPRHLKRKRLVELLAQKYPDHKWEKVHLLHWGRLRQQKVLQQTVASLFPHDQLISNARKEAGIANPATGRYLELDIYLPSLRLAFEFQEKHHYTSLEYSDEPSALFQARDKLKKDLARAKGITLIIVPCWWDRTVDSLVATIKKERPDLLPDMMQPDVDPISETMPDTLLQKYRPNVEGIGEPTAACNFTLSKVDPTGWWLFEKYDGVRGFWNPTERCFFTRSGRRLAVADEIIQAMPTNTFLDGELWFGRNNFMEAQKMVQGPQYPDWTKFKYMVYDIPNHHGIYAERYSELVAIVNNIAASTPFIQLADKEECRGMTHLEEYFQDVLDKGGEGIILRDPAVVLQPGRAAGYLKHKKFRDAEARVIQQVGQHQWECELPTGVHFLASAGSAEFVRRYQPKIGDIVTFKHRGYLLAAKKPKFPTLYRIRTDIKWEEVVNNWREQKPTSNVMPRVRRLSKASRREFFIEYAREQGFDPFDQINWRTISAQQIIARKSGILMENRVRALRQALIQAFPEFKRKNRPHNYWKDPENRRRFLCDLAAKHGFDPQQPENWKRVTTKTILENQGGGLLTQFNGSLARVLEDAFPQRQIHTSCVVMEA